MQIMTVRKHTLHDGCTRHTELPGFTDDLLIERAMTESYMFTDKDPERFQLFQFHNSPYVQSFAKSVPE